MDADNNSAERVEELREDLESKSNSSKEEAKESNGANPLSNSLGAGLGGRLGRSHEPALASSMPDRFSTPISSAAFNDFSKANRLYHQRVAVKSD